MTRRLSGNKNSTARKKRERNIEIERLHWRRYNYATHRFLGGIVRVVCERHCYIPRLPEGAKGNVSRETNVGSSEREEYYGEIAERAFELSNIGCILIGAT